jgi:hypothetical protein
MTAARHKTFVGPTLYTHGRSLNDNREVIRARTEAFVNAVGPVNVLSVCEHAMTFGPFSVVVWYRAPAGLPDGSPVVPLTNDDLAAGLRFRDMPFASLPFGGAWPVALGPARAPGRRPAR